MTHASGPATDSWTAVASGNWSAGSNWSLHAAPTKGEAVVIDSASPLTITFDVPTLSIGALTLVDDALDLQSGSLVVTGATALQSVTIEGVKTFVTDGSTSVEGASIGGSVYWFNFGAVTQSGGTVKIGDATSSAAEILNEAGATWTISDASGFAQGAAAGSRFINAGTFQKTSGSGVALVQMDFSSSGTIASQGGGDIEFDGKITSISGTYIGSGMIDYGPDGVATLGAVNVTASCCQTSWGTVDLVGTMTMNDGSTIANESGAHWNFDGDSSLLLAAGQAAGPDINGVGAISKIKGTGTSVVGVDVEAQGQVSVNTGTLEFEGAVSTFSGPINGAGTFEIGGGQAQIGAGASLSVADWTLAGGTTTIEGSITYDDAFTGDAGATLALGGAAASLTLTGPPVITGQDALAGLDVVGSGKLILDVDTIVSAATLGGTVDLIDEFSVAQTGNLTLGDAFAADQASLTVGFGGSWNINGGANILLGANSAAAITIGTGTGSGVLDKLGSGVSVVAPTVVNNGPNVYNFLGGYEPRGVNVEGGTLDFQGAVQGTGSDNITGTNSNNLLTESTLEFDKAVAAGQTVVFFGVGGALYLNDLPQFSGSITNFDTLGGDDSLLIGGGYAFLGAASTATSTTLSFALITNHTTETLTLTGNYEGKTFSPVYETGGVVRIM